MLGILTHDHSLTCLSMIGAVYLTSSRYVALDDVIDKLEKNITIETVSK